MLFNVISINFNIDGKFVIEVSELVIKFVKMVKFDKDEVKCIGYVGFIGEFGLFGLYIDDFFVFFGKFNY